MVVKVLRQILKRLWLLAMGLGFVVVGSSTGGVKQLQHKEVKKKS